MMTIFSSQKLYLNCDGKKYNSLLLYIDMNMYFPIGITVNCDLPGRDPLLQGKTVHSQTVHPVELIRFSFFSGECVEYRILRMSVFSK